MWSRGRWDHESQLLQFGQRSFLPLAVRNRDPAVVQCLFRLLLPRSLPFQMLWQMIESLLMEEDLLAWREVPTFLLFVQWNGPEG